LFLSFKAFAPELLNDVDCFIVIPYPVPEKIKLKPFQRSFACSKVIMENRGQPYSESLKKTLNCYQLSSLDSLSGPSGLSALTAKLWFKVKMQFVFQYKCCLTMLVLCKSILQMTLFNMYVADFCA